MKNLIGCWRLETSVRWHTKTTTPPLGFGRVTSTESVTFSSTRSFSSSHSSNSHDDLTRVNEIEFCFELIEYSSGASYLRKLSRSFWGSTGKLSLSRRARTCAAPDATAFFSKASCRSFRCNRRKDHRKTAQLSVTPTLINGEESPRQGMNRSRFLIVICIPNLSKCCKL